MGGHLVLRKYVPLGDKNSTNPDLNALVALINAADDVDGAKLTTTVEQLRGDTYILPFRPVSETYLAKDEGDPIGYARLEKMVTEEADCFVCRGIVRPDRPGEGIGTRLVQHALTRAHALKGRTPSYFDVDTSTTVAGAGKLARSLDLKPVRWFPLWAERSRRNCLGYAPSRGSGCNLLFPVVTRTVTWLPSMRRSALTGGSSP